MTVVFPVHPRTRKRLQTLGLKVDSPRLLLFDPMSYLQFLALQRDARAVITDSGGIQEETTFLGVPCLTVRSNTERPVTATLGTNTLVGNDMKKMREALDAILAGHAKKGTTPPLWDGRSAERLARVVDEHL